MGRPLSGPVAPGPAASGDRVVVLGAGRAARGSLPSAVVDIHHRGRVMDWLLDAFSVLGAPEVFFVGGYRAEDVVEQYPGLHAVFNRDWETTGPVHSLGLAPVGTGGRLFVSYADVVFRRPAVERLRDAAGDVVLAVDTRWRARYDGRGPGDLAHAEKLRLDAGRVVAIGPDVEIDTADAEYAGVARLDPGAAAAAFALIESGELGGRASIPELVRRLIADGFEVATVDLEGDWAELDARQDLARFVLGTKAESLERLQGMQHGGEIGALGVITLAEWRADREATIRRVLDRVPGERLIVRSSARSEDTWDESGAGRHESVLDVARTDDALTEAVETVLASYGKAVDDDQVLVQEMLRDVAMSGVIMTRTHALGAPYYVVNFDDRTARTDTVTGGGDVRSIVCFRGAPLRPGLPAALGSVLATVQSIEKLVGHDSLDIEFAVTGEDRVHVLQVRPIALNAPRTPVDDDAVAAALAQGRALVEARRAPPPGVVGSSTRLSVMTDWNPAEIIGTKPRRLATSLYRSIVTDETWARQRAEYGYRDLRPCPLLVEIAEQPYVDVRASFASFVPASVPDDVATRLVDHALARLAAQPSLHDKAEFALLVTCLAPDHERALATLRDAGFTSAETEVLTDQLRAITVAGIRRTATDLATLDVAGAVGARIDAAAVGPLERAAHHLDLARRGALVFAHLARSAFVATSMLRGLVAAGAVDPDRAERFQRSVVTVFGRLQDDAAAVRAGRLDFAALVDRYGHLRPGTYDITAPSYRAAPDEYLRPLVDGAEPPPPPEPFAWTAAERAGIADALRAVDLPVAVDELDEFVLQAIVGREEGKFVFTRALSAALDDMVAFGDGVGLGPEELSHVRVEDLLRCRDALADPVGFLRARVAEGRAAHEVAQAVLLPGQVAAPDDLVCFEQAVAEPNYVTRHAVQAPVVEIAGEPNAAVAGRIVMVPSADPGYDWLLARGIAGLVTMYGGANSHMAVRAAESGLPAVIGVGEQLYERLRAASVVRVDCGSRTVTVVS